MPLLRPSLVPPAPDPARVARLTALTRAVEGALDAGADASALIEAFNGLAGRTYTAHEVGGYDGWTSLEAFVDGAARPDPVGDPSVTREELVEVVRRIRAGVSVEGEGLTESEEGGIL